MMKPSVYMIAALAALGVLSVAQAADTEELPPVPFIIGGDEAVAPAQSVEAGPLMLAPEAPESTPSSSTGDIGEPVPAAAVAAPAPVEAKPEAPAEPAPQVPAVVQGSPAPAPSLLPGYVLEEPKVPTRVVATDGSSAVRGLENTLPGQLLPAVTASPAVASLGREFPELHVDQIPLEDLLGYLQEFSPKKLHTQLINPVYVTVDLKANSVEEVLGYLSARYPLEITSDASNIYVRPGVPHPAVMPAASPAVGAVPLIEPTPAQEEALAPTLPAMYDGSKVMPIPTYDATLPASVPVSYDYQPVVIPAGASWQDARTQAQLQRLQAERAALLKERAELQEAVRRAQLRGRL